MHQPISESSDDLKKDLAELRVEYRAAARWARFVIDYKRAYEKEEDFGEDSLRDYIAMIREDSRDELKKVAVDIKRLKARIRLYENCLMDLAKGKKKMTEEEFDLDGGIFTDPTVSENLRKNAEAVGINPDLVAPEEDADAVKYFAKRGCKKCHGRGTLSVCFSPCKKKAFFTRERPTVLRRGRRVRLKGPTPKRLIKLTNFSPGNDLDEQWHTSQPEPEDYKKNNTALVFCRCVKSVGA